MTSSAACPCCSVTKQLLDKEANLKEVHACSAEAIGNLQNQLDQQLKIVAQMEAMVQVGLLQPDNCSER